VNVDGDTQKMTSARANSFGEFYDDGKLPANMGANAAAYKKGHADVLKNCMVSVKRVADLSDCSTWCECAKSNVYKADKDGLFCDFQCSCPAFSQSNNRCPQVVAMACLFKIVDIDVLLDGATARNSAGRPRKDRGALDKSGNGRKEKDATWWLREITSAAPLRYHKHAVAMKRGDETVVGRIKSVVQVDGKLNYKIQYPDDSGEEDEVLTVAEVARGLALADLMGVRGVCGI
jgi:hypothetical protein